MRSRVRATSSLLTIVELEKVNLAHGSRPRVQSLDCYTRATVHALDGIIVLDLSRLLPGPFCTMLLADLGADVIKVEDTEGGDYLRWMPPLVGRYSAMFHALNRGKRSLALNLKTDGGRDAFLRVVERADVVVEGFRPGVLDRLGVGYDSLRARNPGLILCSITGYGQDGPLRDRVGHDINYLALAGALSITGCSPEALAIPGVQVGDIGGGALGAAVAVLAALHERNRTGEGRHCDVSMLDGLMAWMTPVIASYRATADVPAATTLTLNGRHPCYRLYRCADGYLSVGALEPKFWTAFVEAIGLAHLADRGLASGDEAERVAAEVEAALRTGTREHWRAAFEGREVCCEPVLSVSEALEHPQVRARGLGRTEGSGPGYGEHTREVLAAAGLDEAAVDSLARQGATIAEP
jgi:crotonobetainyl-CoA:carnitine CoA-transferase CaiB-like acyl-CoA transferase